MRRAVFICVIAIAFASALPASAEGPNVKRAALQSWQSKYDHGSAALDSGDSAKAEKMFRESLQYAEKNSLPLPFVADSQEALGHALISQHRFEEAEVIYRAGLKSAEGSYGPDADTTLKIKVGLGISLTGIQEYRSAEPMLIEALSAYHHKAKVKDCELATPLDALAVLYKASKQYDHAASVYSEATGQLADLKFAKCEAYGSLIDHLAELYAASANADHVQKLQKIKAELAVTDKGRTKIAGGATVQAGLSN